MKCFGVSRKARGFWTAACRGLCCLYTVGLQTMQQRSHDRHLALHFLSRSRSSGSSPDYHEACCWSASWPPVTWGYVRTRQVVAKTIAKIRYRFGVARVPINQDRYSIISDIVTGIVLAGPPQSRFSEIEAPSMTGGLGAWAESAGACAGPPKARSTQPSLPFFA